MARGPYRAVFVWLGNQKVKNLVSFYSIIKAFKVSDYEVLLSLLTKRVRFARN